MYFTLIPPAYPYAPALPPPNEYYPSYMASGSFVTEPAGAAAGAYDPYYYMQPIG